MFTRYENKVGRTRMAERKLYRSGERTEPDDGSRKPNQKRPLLRLARNRSQ